MELDNYYKNLAKNIKKIRLKHNLTQEKLAELCGISLDYLGKIEVNINKPGLKTIFKIAKTLNVSPQIFFED